MLKTIFLFFSIITFFGLQANSCSSEKNPYGEMVYTGPDKFTSLVVFFKKDATREQIEDFNNKILSVPRPELGGHDLPAGVALRYLIRNGNYEGVGITFSTEATSEEREKLKKTIKGSPIVFRLYENVVPNEIKDLN